MPVIITAERPDTTDAIQLIEDLEKELAGAYPPESRHGYSVDKLIKLKVAFFVTRVDGMPAGCGGVQLFGKDYGELKRMYVRPSFRGMGLAKLMLEQLTAHAHDHDVHLLRLETGIDQHNAIALYEKWGFYKIAPFGEYKPDPLALFYEKQID